MTRRIKDVDTPIPNPENIGPECLDTPNGAEEADGSQDPWVIRLRGEPEIRDAALEELREFLVRGLAKSMSHRYNACLQPDDVVQDALIKILESLDQFAGRSRFTTWAMTVAVRIGISQMRRKYFDDVSIDSLTSEDQSPMQIAIDETDDPGDQMDRQSMVETLQRLIDTTLTEKQQKAMRSNLSGMPVEVIAEKMGTNRNAIYKLVHDARIKLKRGLEQSGIQAEDIATAFA
ncbi:MAG: sigma-70 family RNA polymerase sigma factor [Planctomycetota bacterium]